jgi:hypothetical protein
MDPIRRGKLNRPSPENAARQRASFEKTKNEIQRLSEFRASLPPDVPFIGDSRNRMRGTNGYKA